MFSGPVLAEARALLAQLEKERARTQLSKALLEAGLPGVLPGSPITITLGSELLKLLGATFPNQGKEQEYFCFSKCLHKIINEVAYCH